jgi:hypothetical protein
MPVSEGTFQTERGFKVAAGAFELLAGARYHPFSLRTVLWERADAAAIDLFLEIVDGDRVYEIDSVLGTADKKYHFPNARATKALDLVPAARVRFRTSGGTNQSAAITWAELGAP